MTTPHPVPSLSEELLSFGMTVKLAGVPAGPVMGLAALGIPLAGYLGLRVGEGRGQEDARKRALTGFGAGMAAGVAAPRVIGKVQNVLQKLQGGGSAFPAQTPQYSKRGSVEEFRHLDMLLAKEAAGILEGGANLLGRAIRGGGKALKKTKDTISGSAQKVQNTPKAMGKAFRRGRKGKGVKPPKVKEPKAPKTPKGALPGKTRKTPGKSSGGLGNRVRVPVDKGKALKAQDANKAPERRPFMQRMFP